jgi:hypothetical protein
MRFGIMIKTKMEDQMNNKKRAYRLAKHYFGLIADCAGLPWGNDHDAEIEQLIDAIIAAAREKDNA